LKSVTLRVIGAIALLAFVSYVGDDLLIRYRIPRDRDPFATVAVQPYYAIHQKNGKTEYDSPSRRVRFAFALFFLTSAIVLAGM